MKRTERVRKYRHHVLVITNQYDKNLKRKYYSYYRVYERRGRLIRYIMNKYPVHPIYVDKTGWIDDLPF